MRIGIFIGDFEQLKNWELRIIDKIRNDPELELALLVKDGRQGLASARAKLFRSLREPNFLGKTALHIQEKIERRIFKEMHTVDRKEIIAYLETIQTEYLSPERRRYLDIFSEEDASRIEKYELDVILRHTFNIIRGSILKAARYGIWSFHHGDNAINRGGPAGFWEIILKQSVLGSTLQQLTPKLDGGKVIGKAYFDCSYSFIKNNSRLAEQSVSLLFKYLNALKRGAFHTEDSPPYYYPLFRSPSLWVVMRYMFRFYVHILKLGWKWLANKFLGMRYNCWTLFIVKGNIFTSSLFRYAPVEPPKGHFWADPFLYRYGDQYYVFFENYAYASGRGRISCGRIEEGRIVDVTDVLDMPYHLSYPYIVEEEGTIYLIPECYNNRRMEVYICEEFPHRWKLHATAFEDESIADTTYLKDDEGQRWLFLNKGFNNDHMAELHIFKIDSLGMNKIEPHWNNPVIIDSRIGRNAGRIFKYKDQWIRPSQNNSHGTYGYGLNLNRIKKLSIKTYEEERLHAIGPHFRSGLIGIHHVDQQDNIFIFDGCFRRR